MENKAALTPIDKSSNTLSLPPATGDNRNRIIALFLRFSLAWGAKWIEHQRAVGAEPLIAEWSQGLAGLTDADLARGFAACRDTLDWPPSIAEMRRASMPPPVRRRLADILDGAA